MEHRSLHLVQSRSSAEHGAVFAAARSMQESNLIFPCVAPAKAAWLSMRLAAPSAWWYSARDDGCLSFRRRPFNGSPLRWKIMEELLAATLALAFSRPSSMWTAD